MLALFRKIPHKFNNLIFMNPLGLLSKIFLDMGLHILFYRWVYDLLVRLLCLLVLDLLEILCAVFYYVWWLVLQD